LEGGKMYRTIEAELNNWKQAANRKPLLLFGARQVGKSYTLAKFGKSQFENYIHIDFMRDASAKQIFSGSLAPTNIIPQLETFANTDITPGKTLIIFDEVQLCDHALTSLKYFCEDAPQYHVCAAGSLLGVKLQKDRHLFPVGKVDMMQLHPMSISEYFAARSKSRMIQAVKACTEAHSTFSMHDEAMALTREYMLIGGMPEVVGAFCQVTNASAGGTAQAFAAARAKQLEIDQAYVADIAKYAPTADVPKIIDVWQSIPTQLAKENHKFQYKAVKTGGRAKLYETALSWLQAAALIEKCTKVTDACAPLKTFAADDSFKIYRADTGLLAASYEALPSDVLPDDSRGARFRGALCENYVSQQLAARNVRPYYWGVASKSEVEFIARDLSGNIVPIEVKSGTNVRANSLVAFREKYNPKYVVRVSAKNFGEYNGVINIPLYAVEAFGETLVKTLPAFL
jgi:predicted AAA+ superfamily ATPase